MADEKDQQNDGLNDPATLSTKDQPAGTTRVENGVAYDISGKSLGPANLDGQNDAPKDFDFGFGSKQQPRAAAAQAAQAAAAPAGDQSAAGFNFGFKEQPAKPAEGRGVWARLKANAYGMTVGLYKAMTDPATEEEKRELLEKIMVEKENDKKRWGIEWTPEQEAEYSKLASDPSHVTLAWHRLVDAPADQLLSKSMNETQAAKELWAQGHKWKAASQYMGASADTALSAVPLMGPMINDIAERAESGDVSGAATDIGFMIAMEHAPGKIKELVKGDRRMLAQAQQVHARTKIQYDARLREADAAAEAVNRANSEVARVKDGIDAGTHTPDQLNQVREAASEAASNSRKAQQALREASDARGEAGFEAQRWSRKVNNKIQAAAAKDSQRVSKAVDTGRDFMQRAIPARGTDFYVEDPKTKTSDYDIVRAHLEAEKAAGTPVETIQDARDAAEISRAKVENKVGAAVKYYSMEPLKSVGEDSPLMKTQKTLEEMAGVDNSFKDAIDNVREKFNLTDITLGEAQKTLTKLNDYLRDSKARTGNWDTYNKIETDPDFAAHYFLADNLRDAIYSHLEGNGVSGAREARYETKALIDFRNLADAQLRRNMGGVKVRGSGVEGNMVRGIIAKGAKKVVSGASTAVGAKVAGPAGAVLGHVIGEEMGGAVHDFIAPEDLSRDEHVEKSMNLKASKYTPTEVTMDKAKIGADVPVAEPAPAHTPELMERPKLTPRANTDLHSDLANYYDHNSLDEVSYAQLEQDFRDDMATKRALGVKKTAEEASLMKRILEADGADKEAHLDAMKKAVKGAKSQGEAAPVAEPKLATQETGVKAPPEKTTGKPEVDEAIKAGGGIPGGVMKGDAKIGVPELALFHDPESGTTLALKTEEGITPEKVKAHLERSRAAYAEAEKAKSASTEAENEDKLTMGEHQTSLKNPYNVAVQMPDGTVENKTVQAYSFKAAIREAQKVSEGARAIDVRRGEIPAEDLTYKVPKGKLASMPGSITGKTPEQTIYHELGHAMVGIKNGMATSDMLRHTHRDLRRSPNSRAAVQWNVDPSNPNSLFNHDGSLKPERLDHMLETLAGGIASDEVFNGMDRNENPNFTSDVSNSDANLMRKYMRKAGVAAEDVEPMMHAAIERAKAYLQNEHVSNVMKENAPFREKELSSQYHYSEQRLKSLHAEAQRRMGAANEQTRTAGPAGPAQGNNRGAGGEVGAGVGQTLPGAERAGPTEPVQPLPAEQGATNAAYAKQIDEITKALRAEKLNRVLEQIQNLQKMMAADITDQEKGLISTRQPTGKKATENALRDNLVIGRDAIDNAPGMLEKVAKRIKQYVGTGIPKELRGDPGAVVSHFTNHLRDNLIDLYNKVDPAKREATAKWYDSANKFAANLADKYNSTVQQVSGVIAAMSPQKDWDQNVSLAERVTDTHFNHQDTVTTPSMMERGKFLAKERNAKGKLTNPAMKTVLPKIAGKSFAQVEDPIAKAAWVRLHDEVTRPREYNKIDPGTGDKVGVVRSDSGEPRAVAWGSLKEISKALSVLEDGSRENISNSLGEAHKVRNFYNNILDPNNPAGHVTIDTHAVAAAHQQPFSGKSSEVKFNFGGIGSKATGAKGLYGIYADAYRQAASQLGIQPRQLQSIVWEKVREDFPDRFKRAAGGEHVDAIKGIWRKYDQGKATLPDTRRAVADYASKKVAETKAPAPEEEMGLDKDEPQ